LGRRKADPRLRREAPQHLERHPGGDCVGVVRGVPTSTSPQNGRDGHDTSGSSRAAAGVSGAKRACRSHCSRPRGDGPGGRQSSRAPWHTRGRQDRRRQISGAQRE
ncbi:unnamed protein product, partial [Scytosiphon promiscuus]